MKAKLFEYVNADVVPYSKTKHIKTDKPQLILAFGEKGLIKNPEFYTRLRACFPFSEIAICSTAGEIYDQEVYDETVVITALEFEKTHITTAKVNIADYKNSLDAGIALAQKILADDLNYVMVLSDGALINGSELISGITSVLPENVPVTGGLAADGIAFQSTGVGLNEVPKIGEVVAIGFSGKHLQVGHASMGGWDTFGPEKIVTKSTNNILYEIDDYNALELYKDYLGKYAEGLPSSALLFPLAIIMPNSSEILVRTILSIDEANQCLTFAGDIPMGSKVKLMKANFDNLIDAASQAASLSFNHQLSNKPDYALLISCVGRKIILKQRVDEEVEAVAEIFDNNTTISGFYSNGELSPFNKEGRCQLHNQTMTITTFSEN